MGTVNTHSAVLCSWENMYSYNEETKKEVVGLTSENQEELRTEVYLRLSISSYYFYCYNYHC